LQYNHTYLNEKWFRSERLFSRLDKSKRISVRTVRGVA
jgi:hypothetical protein